MAEGGGTPSGDADGSKGNDGTVGGGKASDNGAPAGSEVGGTPSGEGKGGGDTNSNTPDSDNSKSAPSAETSTTPTATDPSKSNESGYSFSGAIDASLADTIDSLTLSFDDAKDAATKASRGSRTGSFGSTPSSLGSLAADAALGHLGKSSLTGTMAGLAARSGKAGLSAAVNAVSDPTALTSALTGYAAKGYGMDTTAHNVGGAFGALAGGAIGGPLGAAIGQALGIVATEGLLDGFDARDHEMARDVMEAEHGNIKGRAEARSMSALALDGFTDGLNDPSLADHDAHTAGVIGMAQAISDAVNNLGDPTDGIGVSPSSISGMDTTDNSTNMGLSSEIGNTLANINDALDAISRAPDRSSELGSPGITASSVDSFGIDAQEASRDALGGSVSFAPTRSYGWLRAGLPVSVPSSPYRNSYWDGTRFINMNDYRGFM